MKKYLEGFILLLILVNVAAFSLETVDSVNKEYRTAFAILELVSVIIFSMEYGVRTRLGGKKYATSLMGIVDIVALVSLMIPVCGLDLIFLRLLRLLQAFKLFRYIKCVESLKRVVTNTWEHIALCFILYGVVAFIYACFMYVIEKGHSANFDNVFASLWWACVTLTTVGYGDVVPVTAAGKAVAMLAMFNGILFFALPTSILGAAWLEELKGEMDVL